MPVNVEELYKKYGPMVLRRCRSLLRNEEEAYDAMQEVFIQVLKKKGDILAYAPSSLLYTIATNICLNVIRSNRRKFENEIDDSLLTISDYSNFEPRLFARSTLDLIFEREQETTRTISVLHYLDKFTLEETAEIVGMSVSGIRKRLRKLREKGMALKEAL